MHSIDEVIDSVRKDQVSGSSLLVDTLIRVLINLDPTLSEHQKSEIAQKIESLSSERPFFAVLKHLSERLKKGWNSDSLTLYLEEIEEIHQEIIHQFISLTQPPSNVFLLHSHSETIIRAFELIGAAGMKPKIFQTISEPQHEGLIQASRLKQFGLQVEMVDDEVSESVLDQIDYFVTGADLISPHNIINKKGTQNLAAKIIGKGKSYIVLADPRKLIEQEIDDLPETFEIIPRKLISKLITG